MIAIAEKGVVGTELHDSEVGGDRSRRTRLWRRSWGWMWRINCHHRHFRTDNPYSTDDPTCSSGESSGGVVVVG
jgi:hypothetical protein